MATEVKSEMVITPTGNDGDKLETAQAFAKNYIHEELAKSVEERLSAFDAETLTLELKRKLLQQDENDKPAMVAETKPEDNEASNKDVNVKENGLDQQTKQVDDVTSNTKVEENNPKQEVKAEATPEITVTVSESDPEGKVQNNIEGKVDPIETEQEKEIETEVVEHIPECPVSTATIEEEEVFEVQHVKQEINEPEPVNETSMEQKATKVEISECPTASACIVVDDSPVAKTFQNEEDQTKTNQAEAEPKLDNGHLDGDADCNNNEPIASLDHHVDDGEEEQEEDLRKQIKKLGINDKIWKERLAMNQKENEKRRAPVDKFRTIKQNIRKGNTRSLKERFESLSKLTE